MPGLGAHRFFDANQSKQIGVRHWLVCQKLYIDENVAHTKALQRERVSVRASDSESRDPVRSPQPSSCCDLEELPTVG